MSDLTRKCRELLNQTPSQRRFLPLKELLSNTMFALEADAIAIKRLTRQAADKDREIEHLNTLVKARWTSIDDKSAPEFDCVLVIDATQPQHTASMAYLTDEIGRDGELCWHMEGPWFTDNKITHWMWLPPVGAT